MKVIKIHPTVTALLAPLNWSRTKASPWGEVSRSDGVVENDTIKNYSHMKIWTSHPTINCVDSSPQWEPYKSLSLRRGVTKWRSGGKRYDKKLQSYENMNKPPHSQLRWQLPSMGAIQKASPWGEVSRSDGVVAKMQQKRLHESEVFLNTSN